MPHPTVVTFQGQNEQQKSSLGLTYWKVYEEMADATEIQPFFFFSLTITIKDGGKTRRPNQARVGKQDKENKKQKEIVVFWFSNHLGYHQSGPFGVESSPAEAATFILF